MSKTKSKHKGIKKSSIKLNNLEFLALIMINKQADLQ